MIKDPIIKFFLILIFLLVLPENAEAHRPYVIKIKEIKSETGEILILERLYGDGIFVADPAKLQLRNSKGAVIASSPIGGDMGYFCPAISFCWAIPYGPFHLFSWPWKLNYQDLPYEKELSVRDGGKKEDVSNILQYVKDKSIKRVDSDLFEYPEYSKKGPHGFSRGSYWTIFISPVFMISNHFVHFIGLYILYLIPFLLYIICRRFMAKKKESFRTVFWIIFAVIILIYLLFSLICTFIAVFFLSTPILYNFIFLGFSIRFGWKYFQKKNLAL